MGVAQGWRERRGELEEGGGLRVLSADWMLGVAHRHCHVDIKHGRGNRDTEGSCLLGVSQLVHRGVGIEMSKGEVIPAPMELVN